MSKLKSFSKTKIGKITFLGVGAFFVLVLLVKVLAPTSSVTQLASTMQNTRTDMVDGDVKLNTQETLSTVEGQTTRLSNQLSTLTKEHEAWQNQEKTNNADFKKEINDSIKEQEKKLNAEIANYQEKLKARGGEKSPKKMPKKDVDGFVIGNNTETTETQGRSEVTWINDPATSIAKTSATSTASDSLLHPNVAGDPDTQKPKPIPYYTIPSNTALVNIRPLQPLIGVIPTDGTVVDPETVLFSVGKKGLLANQWPLPDAIKGMKGSARCSGVFNFNHSAVKCSITSLTFIFSDGRIDTINSDGQNSLGKLTDHYGNDYIPGNYYGNAAYAAAGTGFFSAIQGWGGAFAQSQVENTSNAAGTFSSTTFKSANSYAGGQALQSAGQAFNTWWQQLLKSTTNYVLVPNWNKSTHQLLLLNAVITTSIPINYDKTGRKVVYSHDENDSNNSLD